MPKISVIIPVYNKEKYISRILDQLIHQSFDNYECLLIDDGSTDNSGLICDEFSSCDNRFKVFHIQNGGVSNARNIGLDNAIGEFITFIDADDEIHTDYLKILYDTILRSKADMVVGSYVKFWDGIEKKCSIIYPNHSKLLLIDDLMPSFARIQLETGIFGYCVAKIFPKKVVEKIHLRFDENIKLAEDFDFYLKLYPHISSMYFTDKAVYYYRQEAENSFMLEDDYCIDYFTQFKIYIKYKDMLKELNYFNRENEVIINNKLRDYLYFSIFYCPFDMYNERFDELRKIKVEESISTNGNSLYEKMVLFMFKMNLKFSLKFVLKLYRFIREIKKKVI